MIIHLPYKCDSLLITKSNYFSKDLKTELKIRMIKSLRAEGLTVVNFEGLKPKSIDFDCSGIGQLISFEPNSDIDNFDKFGHALHQDTGVKLSDSDY